MAGFHALPQSDAYLDAASKLKKLAPDISAKTEDVEEGPPRIPYLRSGMCKN